MSAASTRTTRCVKASGTRIEIRLIRSATAARSDRRLLVTRRPARRLAGRATCRHARAHGARQPRPRGHRHRPQPGQGSSGAHGGEHEGREVPHLHQARRRGQAAVDSRCARESGDAIHHAAGAGQPGRRPGVPASFPATTSPAICCSSTAWTPAIAGC